MNHTKTIFYLLQLFSSLCLCVSVVNSPTLAQGKSEPILVDSPQTLTGDPIPCQRIALGEDDDYKPCLALLPNGELLLVAFHQHKKDKNKVLEQNILFRSKEGGKTWSA